MGVVEYMGRWRMFKPEGTAAMYKGVAALIHQELGELRKLPFLERKVREVGGRGSQVRLAGPQRPNHRVLLVGDDLETKQPPSRALFIL